MDRLRQKMMSFMYGRYGNDQLGAMLTGVSVACLVVYLFIRIPFIYLAGVALLSYSVYRTFSKNTAKMAAQNQKFLTWRYRQAVKKDNAKKHWAQRKDYRFYKCPKCRQKVRVPRGRGKIAITCPKCTTEFIKKS